MNYQRKLEKLENRRQDSQFIRKIYDAESATQILNESYKSISYPNSVKYTLAAMSEVDDAYTQNTINEGERIKNHLESLKDDDYSFDLEYQGSVSNKTHIKAHSDIDILVIQKKFCFFSPSKGGTYPGNWKEDQRKLRQACYDKINSVFYTAEVDNSGTFAIAVSGGSLNRKVDIVPACLDKDEIYNQTQRDTHRGIRVYNKNISDHNKNYPFLNNLLIDLKDNRCHGNYRNAIRLLKTLKADSDRDIQISSYDIVSILYHLDDQYYNVGSQYLTLVTRIKELFLDLINSPSKFRSLDVPDGTRKISEKVTIESLSAMSVEIGELENDLVTELSTVYKSLNESVSLSGRSRL